MFIDTHSHLYLGELAHHIPEAIEHLKERNFSHTIQIGTSVETSKICIELAHTYDIVRATVGIHPCEAQNIPIEEIPEQINILENMIRQERNTSLSTSLKDPKNTIKVENGIDGKTTNFVVGYGEIGFDEYHLSHDPEEAELQKIRQKAWFHAQAKLAIQYDLPVVIHTRNCASLTLEELKNSGLKKFVIHCFSEDREFAENIFALSRESKISFTGILTYPKSGNIQEVAQITPLDRIMIETDAPYLIPQDMKGKVKYCEPSHTLEVYYKLCELREESPDTLEIQLWENSVDFFDIREMAV